MKASEMLKKINTLLGVQVELEELILDNGTRIFADSYDKEKAFLLSLKTQEFLYQKASI